MQPRPDDPSASAAWWESAVVYQVYPRSFSDSDADGQGDLGGVCDRLPYLADLGVDALWLSPFYPSPMKDGGYDVSDYCAVHPELGDLAMFDRLVEEAAELKVRVLVDLVPNHCSTEHPLFLKALAAAPGSAERDLFIFRDQPNNWPSFFGGSAWSQVPDGQHYLHLFDESQADWNWRNPAVPTMFEEILRFWLDRDAAGFRVDVANALFKAADLPDLPDEMLLTGIRQGDQTPFQDQPELDALYSSWRDLLASYGDEGFPGPRMIIGETWNDEPVEMVRFIDAGMTQTFDFRLIGKEWSEPVWRETIAMAYQDEIPTGASPWVLGNHDVPRLATRLGINQVTGLDDMRETLRRGVHADLAVGSARARAATLVLLGLPGGAYIYQGDELALPEFIEIPDELRQDPMFLHTGGDTIGRDGCRVPLPWAGDRPPYGFTDEGVATWLPQPEGWGGYAVASQLRDPSSAYWLCRSALRLRRDLTGELEWEQHAPHVLAYRRGSVRCLANFGEASAPLPEYGELLVASQNLDDPGSLPGSTAVWLRD